MKTIISFPSFFHRVLAAGWLAAFVVTAFAGLALAAPAKPGRFPSPDALPAGLTAEDWANIAQQLPPVSQQAYLKASNTGMDDNFGAAVAVSGDTVVIGAQLESSNATGVNGDQGDDSARYAGAAYVFVRDGTTWTQQAYLKGSNTETGDWFGWSVAVSGDTVVVGAHAEDSNATGVNGNQADNSAPFAGAAYVFVRDGTNWSQQAYLKASNAEAGDSFGWTVAVWGDTLVVGADGEDSKASEVNGDQADNSATDSGAVYVFVRTGTNWSQQAYLKASIAEAQDKLGGALALWGDTLVVGASGEDSNATGVNGNPYDNSAPFAGAAYVFVRDGTNWTQQAYLKASNTEERDRFGDWVAVWGDTLVVGALDEDSNATGVNGNQADNSATDSGAAYVFARTGTSWSQQAYLKASNTGSGDGFGIVGVWSNTVLVGASYEASNATGVNGNQADDSADYAGAAYVFARTGTNWFQAAYLKASNTGENDRFGGPLGLWGDTMVVGAFWEDSNATGVNGNQADNSITNAGAAYVFLTALTTGTPIILQHPQDHSVEPGMDMTFFVEAASASVISYQWRKNGFPIVGATSPTLPLNNVQPSDTGLYDVVLTDAVGTAVSYPARLTVLVEPTIVIQPRGVTNVVGSTITLSVQVTNTATLPIGYRWRKSGAVLPRRVLYSHVDCLSLTDVQPDISGSYTVVVTNQANFQPGFQSVPAIVQVEAGPLPPDTDSDGMPDDYETAKGFDRNDPADAALDADGDGVSNGDEYVAGTDPHEPASYLRITIGMADGQTAVRLSFRAEADQTYSVQARDEVDSEGWITIGGAAAGAARDLELIDSIPGAGSRRTYRLVTPAVSE